ncbi:MAG: Uma2 family endonuclease [Tepidisphaeraceae bacterium]
MLIQDAAAGRARIIGLTVAQYDYLIEHKLLDEDLTLELLDGLIVKKDRAATGGNPDMIGDRHRAAVMRLAALAGHFSPHGSYIQTQQPIRLPPWHEPEPDASIIRGDPMASIEKPWAADVLCVIEVADSSLARDLRTKLRAYAEAGIPQYVVVDLVHDVVLDHANPSGAAYPAPKSLRRGDILRLSAGVGRFVDVPVDRLLP